MHWIALVEYSQMSTHLPGFQWFLRFFASFGIDQISHQQHKVKAGSYYGLALDISNPFRYSEEAIRWNWIRIFVHLSLTGNMMP